MFFLSFQLTNTEMQLEAANKNYREMFDLKDALETKVMVC